MPEVVGGKEQTPDLVIPKERKATAQDEILGRIKA